MFIADTQVACQQYLLRMIPRGYVWWTSGVCSSEDLDSRSSKYEEHYGTKLNSARCYYRKTKGLANAKLVAVKQIDGNFIWFLIATDGLGLIRENKKLLDTRTNSGRIKWGEDYVLYEAVRPRVHGGGKHWSWFVQPKKQKEIEHYIGYLIKNEPEKMKYYIEMQCRRPMHSGIRSFLTRIIRRTAKNWSAVHPRRPWQARDPATPLPILNSFRGSKTIKEEVSTI